MVAVPAATPLTTPVAGSTVAMPVLLLDHTPPVVALASVIVEFVQTDPAPVISATTGSAFMVTVVVVVFVQVPSPKL
jgi:hypothetical protein